MLEYIDRMGWICSRFRTLKGATLEYVAEETNYSKESICAFEKGRLFTYKIFCWYLDAGLDEEWCRRICDE